MNCICAELLYSYCSILSLSLFLFFLSFCSLFTIFSTVSNSNPVTIYFARDPAQNVLEAGFIFIFSKYRITFALKDTT
jgi:hypothetical protein